MSCLFNDTATTEIYTLSLHDALPIYASGNRAGTSEVAGACEPWNTPCAIALRSIAIEIALRASTLSRGATVSVRSEEHTSEVQSRQYLVCRLLLDKNQTQCGAISINP